MDFTEENIEFMREDLESGMRHTKMVEATKKKFKAEGRDFDKEFAAYKAKRVEKAGGKVALEGIKTDKKSRLKEKK